MENKFENILYFGIAFDKFDVLDFGTDFLAGVRANYFNSGLKTLRDKALQHLNKAAYFFNYYFEKGVSADWTFKVNANLAQVSEVVDDEKYCIKTYTEDKVVYKIAYFDNNHKWIKTEYFNNDTVVYCLKNVVSKGQNVIKKITYKNGEETVSYLFPKTEAPEDFDYSVLAYTNMGFVYFNTVPNKGFEIETRTNDFGFAFKSEDFDPEKTSDLDIRNAEYLNCEEASMEQPEIIEETIDTPEEVVPDILEDPVVETIVEETVTDVEDVQAENLEENLVIEEFDEEPDSIINSGSEEYRYYGDIQNGKRHGYGRTVTPSGKTAYEGSYFDDKRNGFGSFYCKNGDLNYFGNWENNNRQGFGVGFRSTDFTAHIGKWNNNTPDGIGARFNRNGDFLFLGEFENGKKQGIGISYDANAGFIVSKFEEDKVVSSQLLKDIFSDFE